MTTSAQPRQLEGPHEQMLSNLDLIRTPNQFKVNKTGVISECGRSDKESSLVILLEKLFLFETFVLRIYAHRIQIGALTIISNTLEGGAGDDVIADKRERFAMLTPRRSDDSVKALDH
ncbi:hypothetical protein ACJJTC_019254 [Scirpophaga incertulas]